MGTEADCTLFMSRGDDDGRHARDVARDAPRRFRQVTGRALLETDELVFRAAAVARRTTTKRASAERLRFKLAGARVEVDGDTLVLEDAAGALARLVLPSGVAARWAEKIRSPPSLLKKLGVTDGVRAQMVGAFDAGFVAELGAAAEIVTRGADVVFFAAPAARELAKVAALRAKLRDDAALWIVYPKGQKEIREADVLGAGRAAGLKDVKVARFSEALTALKFVVPVAARR